MSKKDKKKDMLRQSSEDTFAPDNSADKKIDAKADESASPRFLMRLVAVLTVICVLTAALLAAVNALTADRIEENTLREKTKSVLSIFAGGDNCELFTTYDDGSEIYLVFGNGGITGYCAFVSSPGFGGDIDMMVGIDPDGKTVGVRIVSMSETPGVGTKTNSDSFLGKFTGKDHTAPTEGVDAVAGATISSTAIKSGVEKAHSIEVDLAGAAQERGMQLVYGAADAATETTEVAPPTSDIEEPDAGDAPSEDDGESDPDMPFVNNGGGNKYSYIVDGTEVTDIYVLEIPKDDETAKITEESKKTETTKPKPKDTKADTTAAPKTEPKPAEPTVTESVPETQEPEETRNWDEIPDWLRTDSVEDEPQESVE